MGNDDCPECTEGASPCPVCGVSSGAPRDVNEVEAAASEWTPPRDVDAPRRMSTCGEVGLA